MRAILGQLVSVAMAAKLTAKVVQLYGERLDDFPEYICFPTPQRLAAADPQALKALGHAVETGRGTDSSGKCGAGGQLTNDNSGRCGAGDETLQTFPGIGRWTANYFALRGWQAKDVFLPDDYLIKQRFPGMTPGTNPPLCRALEALAFLCAVAYLVYGRLATRRNGRIVGLMRRIRQWANAPSVNREITAIHQQIQRLGIGNHITINQIDADARKRIHH
ncbi:3-methyladenine DNA glycosylase [Escherichia coli]|uniref:DNA-3-methyladenine glycosylase II n=1 Tax=Escherichia coli TaxID=562 RepID=A0A376U6W3_ECOLX|nr:3-methyladenine DNA glycosylase [Escherichia coli]